MKRIRILSATFALVLALSSVLASQPAAATAASNQPIDGQFPCGVPIFIDTRQLVPFFIIPCPQPDVVSLVRGIAFIDTNANGKWDPGEPAFGDAWLKVASTGSWFGCGKVGDDATFGIPVTPDDYVVLPVAPAGYRTTTPRIPVTVGTPENTPFLFLGFVKDPTSKGDACDQYNPSR
ncbi:MAG TPA: hypothetical protein VGK87_04595 [Anaerolineae bacterium]